MGEGGYISAKGPRVICVQRKVSYVSGRKNVTRGKAVERRADEGKGVGSLRRKRPFRWREEEEGSLGRGGGGKKGRSDG